MKCLFSLLILFSFTRLHAQSAVDNDPVGTMQPAHTDSACAGLPTLQYFSVRIKYPESAVALLKKVQTRILVSNERFYGSGFITFHFTVDCNGHTSGFRHTETDKDYKDFTFSNGLVQLLLQFVQSLNEWPKAHRKDGSPVNYNYYLSFQIKDGTVVTVAP